ncbi:ThiF family adenylyltransferase [Bacteroidota bacterium]
MKDKRYQRQEGISGWDSEAQSSLENATVFIAGLGGLGNPVSMYLAAAGIGCLRICDNDRVELSNLNRQILYTENDIGRPKTDCTIKRISEFNSITKLESLTASINEENIGNLAGNADILVDCLDNKDTRDVLNRFAVENKLPLVHAGVNGLSGQLSFIHSPETPCMNCIYQDLKEVGPVSVLGAVAGTIGALQALEVIKYFTGTGDLLKNRLLIMDGGSMTFHETQIDKKPDCQVCS